jgi:hypothetical protein
MNPLLTRFAPSSLSSRLLIADAIMIVLSILGAVSATPRIPAAIVIAAALNTLLGFGLALFRHVTAAA